MVSVGRRFRVLSVGRVVGMVKSLCVVNVESV